MATWTFFCLSLPSEGITDMSYDAQEMFLYKRLKKMETENGDHKNLLH